MATEKIKMILDIHRASTLPVYKVLDGITEEQLNWHPAPESRSVKEITLHLIRVDNFFLKRLGKETISRVDKDSNLNDIIDDLKRGHRNLQILLSECKIDSELFEKSKLIDATDTDNIKEHLLHSCQHNLYHLSQLIYLRRALDRKWEAPVKDWDKATRIIANYLTAANN